MRAILEQPDREIRAGVRGEFQEHEPETTIDFDAERLSKTSEDDRQIACILAGRKAHAGVEHVCVTTDTNMILKARSRQIAYVELTCLPSEDQRFLRSCLSSC